MKHNCKIKDSTLNLTIKTVELNKINKVGRTIVELKQRLRKAFNVPDRVRIVRLSNHLSYGAKKDLEKSITTEINTYKGKQTIKVKTDIDSKFLKPI